MRVNTGARELTCGKSKRHLTGPNRLVYYDVYRFCLSPTSPLTKGSYGIPGNYFDGSWRPGKITQPTHIRARYVMRGLDNPVPVSTDIQTPPITQRFGLLVAPGVFKPMATPTPSRCATRIANQRSFAYPSASAPPHASRSRPRAFLSQSLVCLRPRHVSSSVLSTSESSPMSTCPRLLLIILNCLSFELDCHYRFPPVGRKSISMIGHVYRSLHCGPRVSRHKLTLSLSPHYNTSRVPHFYLFIFYLISLIADGPHRYHPACGHKRSSHLSPVHALQFVIAMQVQHSYNSSTNG